ncbi:MAG: alpha/beta-hydrolase family protein [Actinomycetota bacterium]|nr:alpha/beta-hydrolase family protein [Actinomycetota bacterium]
MSVAPFSPPLRRRIVRAPLSALGLVCAAPGYVIALTPSLLPRPISLLILLASLGTALAYALGASVGWIWRKIPLTSGWQPRKSLRWACIVIAWIPAVIFTPIAISWQLEQQAELDMPGTLASTVIVLLASLVFALAFIAIGRSIRLGTNNLARLATAFPLLWRWTTKRGPLRQYRRVMTIRVIAAVLVVLLFNSAMALGFNRLVASYSVINADTSGQSQSDLGSNSGSAESLTPWATLGREGRFFVSNTMQPSEISAITQAPATTPLRLYIGVDQAPTPQERSDLAVRELDRTHAWDRDYLAVIALTGTGWVEPDAINALETVTAGNIASIGVQYSAVPSWIGFLIDQETTQIQNADTIHTIIDAWRKHPADHRPKLVLFGESLGAFGSQGAWNSLSTPADVLTDFSSVIWIGPPAGSTLWKAWQADRTAGPAWQPVIGNGTAARVFVSSEELLTAPPAAGKSIAIAAHPNDPVVYWSWDLLFNRPEWIDSPLGPGVDTHIRYSWIITCLQVGMDLVSGGEPPEVGHNYIGASGSAIALTLNPPGWTTAKTIAMQEALGRLRYTTG